ncbi:MAG TPA: Ig-like domain-containing protein [Patescibacteria group bacterium]|nr:Ig-like domain-containing protein [Patescibacteria group bacterium]
MTDVTGTSGDDFLFFSGLEEELDITLTNAYSGETLFISDIYNVNTATYDGLTGNDTLLMTNVGDALFILNDANQQTLFSIERIVAGDGGDIINLASTTVTLGNTFIDGGPSNDILWGNVGNDTIQGAGGDDRIDGGPGNDNLLGQDGNDNVKGGAGNDTLSGGNNDDTLDGNAGNDTVNGDAGNDTLVYTQSENVGATDIYNGGTGTDTLVLRLTAAQANADAADIAAAQAFIASHLNTASSTGPTYTFSSFGLTISNIESITVVITSNTNPVAQDDDFTGTRDQVVAGNVLVSNGHGADSDADGDTLSVQATTLTTTAGGNVVLNSDGTFTYTGATGFTGADSFNYTLLDTHGGSATGTVHLTINPPPNQNPVAHEDDFSGQENHAVTGNLLADNGHGAASDPDGNTVTAVAGTFASAHGGSIIVNADGTFTYTPASNFFGTDSFNYTISDGHGGTATATAFFAMNGTPTTAPASFSGQENQAVTGNLLTGASDPDGGTLTATAGTFATAHGSVTIAGDGSFVYTPGAGYFGADSFNWTVQDGQGGSATGSVSISLNAPPVAQEDDFTGTKNISVSGNVLLDNGHGADSDVDGGILAVVAAVVGTAAGGTVTINGDGTFSYIPATDYIGADSFTYTLLDGQGGSASGTVNLTIHDTVHLPVNHDPVAQEDDFSTTAGQTLTGNVLADNGHGADSDPDGDALTVGAATLQTAAGATVVINADGSFTYHGQGDYIGTDSFNYALADGNGGSATGTVSIAIAIPAGAIVGTNGNDTINGGNHPNLIYGLGGNDTLNGGNSGDTIYGGSGNDVIHGNNGTDTLYAGSGIDFLYGDNGADVLVAGSGSATMTGGNGPDTFKFTSATGNVNTITDFTNNDKLDFSALIQGPHPVQSLIDQFVRATTQGSNTVLSVDADGAANGSNFVDVAILQGIQHFDVAAAFANGTVTA